MHFYLNQRLIEIYQPWYPERYCDARADLKMCTGPKARNELHSGISNPETGAGRKARYACLSVAVMFVTVAALVKQTII